MVRVQELSDTESDGESLVALPSTPTTKIAAKKFDVKQKGKSPAGQSARNSASTHYEKKGTVADSASQCTQGTRKLSVKEKGKTAKGPAGRMLSPLDDGYKSNSSPCPSSSKTRIRKDKRKASDSASAVPSKTRRVLWGEEEEDSPSSGPSEKVSEKTAKSSVLEELAADSELKEKEEGNNEQDSEKKKDKKKKKKSKKD